MYHIAMTTETMTQKKNIDSMDHAPQHNTANEQGVPVNEQEIREAQIAFMTKHRAVYESLANS